MQQAYRAIDIGITRALQERGFDVRPAHSIVLAHIDIEGGTRATVLSERASVSKQAIGEMVTDLEAKGFVKRVRDPADGRAKLIQLTRKGHAAVAAAHEVIGGIETALLKKAGLRNVETTRRTLTILAALATEEERRGQF